MVKFSREEKKFLMELLEEVVDGAKEIEQKDSFLSQNLTRYIEEERRIEFLEKLRNKVNKLPVKE